MTAAELKYLIALRALREEGGRVRVCDLADKMGVSKVSAYRMCERLKAHGHLRSAEGGALALTVRGEGLLEEYTLCVGFVRDALEKCCHTPANIAAREAVGIVCAVGEGSRAALLAHLRKGKIPPENL